MASLNYKYYLYCDKISSPNQLKNILTTHDRTDTRGMQFDFFESSTVLENDVQYADILSPNSCKSLSITMPMACDGNGQSLSQCCPKISVFVRMLVKLIAVSVSPKYDGVCSILWQGMLKLMAEDCSKV